MADSFSYSVNTRWVHVGTRLLVGSCRFKMKEALALPLSGWSRTQKDKHLGEIRGVEAGVWEVPDRGVRGVGWSVGAWEGFVRM